jgi:hypothetical protein
MGVPMAKYGFAVASTDTGHNGSALDGTFVYVSEAIKSVVMSLVGSNYSLLSF